MDRSVSDGEQEGLHQPSSAEMSYDGTLGEILRIALMNSVLTLATLGIYRFWARTRMRRYLWGKIELMDDPLEYLGTPGELFRGFIVAMVVLVPIFGGFSVLQTAYPPIPPNVGLSLTIQGVYLLAILLLVQFAFFRARRYRLTRTQWRGIRGNQTGSGVRYALLATGWFLLNAGTLGLAYPFSNAALQRFRTENTLFGTTRMSFEGRGGDMFGSWVIAWLLLIPSLGTSLFWYRGTEFRYFMNKTRLGAVALKSELSPAKVYLILLWFYLATLLFMIMLGVVFFMFVAGAAMTAGFAAQNGTIDAGSVESSVYLVVLVFVVLSFVVSGLLQAVLLVHPLAQAACDTTSFTWQGKLPNFAQGEGPTLTQGEGLADVLDVGAV